MAEDDKNPPGHRGSPGGAHRHDPPVPIEEATRRAVELNRVARETDPREQARYEKLQADLAKIREKIRRRKERNRYDFS